MEDSRLLRLVLEQEAWNAEPTCRTNGFRARHQLQPETPHDLGGIDQGSL